MDSHRDERLIELKARAALDKATAIRQREQQLTAQFWKMAGIITESYDWGFEIW